MAFLENSYFLLALTFVVFIGARILQKRTGLALLNPILISVCTLIAFLCAAGIPYETYTRGGGYVEFWLKPAVVAARGAAVQTTVDHPKAAHTYNNSGICRMRCRSGVGRSSGATLRSEPRGNTQPRRQVRHHPHRHGSHRRRRRHSASHSRSGCVCGHIRRHDRIQSHVHDTHQKPDGTRTFARHRRPCPRHLRSYRRRRPPLRRLGVAGSDHQRTIHRTAHSHHPVDLRRVSQEYVYFLIVLSQ